MSNDVDALALSLARSIVATAVIPADQEGTRAQILAFIDAHPDALHRSCLSGHLTGSALVVSADGERTLLMHHRKLGRWFQPGGHADGQGDLAAASLREATEETGIAGLVVETPAIDLDVHRVEPPGEAPHLHLDVRHLVWAPPGAEAVGNHESLALRWVDEHTLELLDPVPDPSTRRLVVNGLAEARRRLGR